MAGKREPPEPWTYPGGVIPTTPDALLLHGIQARVHCLGCGRDVELDLLALSVAGRGNQRVELMNPVCSVCGSKSCQVRVG